MGKTVCKGVFENFFDFFEKIFAEWEDITAYKNTAESQGLDGAVLHDSGDNAVAVLCH